MVQVLLVTCDAWPEGEPGAEVLDAAFADRGVSTRWVSWRDSSVDWQDADVVAVRSTWDYANHREEFLGWARSVGPTLLNGVDLFTWNTDKAYLVALAAAGVPIVPTILVDGEEDLPASVAEFERAVVKPSVGAGGRGVVIFDGPDSSPDGLGSPPWVVQPLVESVRTEGEISVFVLGGDPVSQVVKRPAGGEIRVHERYGGATYAAELTDEAGSLAVLTIRAAEKLLGTALTYGRVDMMRMPDGQLVVSELEATEPGLYLDFLPGNGAAFADLVAAQLAG
jgi:glutathione synthase/RimK-type ligase-like ATP-grasp enzyme